MADSESREHPAVQRAREVKEASATQLMAYPNVNGVGVGYKVVAGRRTDVIAVRVYVAKKLPKAALRPEEILPENLQGVPVDVIEATFHIHQGEDNRTLHNPLVGGVSVGNFILGGSGTLAVSVFDNVTKEDMILSNWHVLCGRFDCAIGEEIIQPGTGGEDTGTSSDVVAHLYRAALTDQVDAAIASLTGDRFLLKEILGLGSVTDVGVPQLGMQVKKSGRTTGLTTGTIVDISADVQIGGYPDGVHTFHNQIHIQNGGMVSRPGDSGSLWIDDANRAIALNFAGTSDGSIATANRFSVVMETLNIDLAVGITQQDFIAATADLLL